MHYYSFVAFSPHAVGIPDPLILLDEGVNAFVASTADLDGLLALLKEEGVVVRQVNCLSDHECLTITDLEKMAGLSPSYDSVPLMLEDGTEEL